MTRYDKSPYREMPADLIDGFTVNNTIPVLNEWYDESRYTPVGIDFEKDRPKWTTEFLNKYFSLIKPNFSIVAPENFCPYGNDVAEEMSGVLVSNNITNREVAVVGTLRPWIESLLFNLGNKITVVEYNPPICSDQRLSIINYCEFINQDVLYDCIVSYSSVEHSGLGRYGDELNPLGDVIAMNHMYEKIKTGGKLIWGAPVGIDCLVWNAHRIYGEKRLDMIFENFMKSEVNQESMKRLKKISLSIQNIGNFVQPISVFEK